MEVTVIIKVEGITVASNSMKRKEYAKIPGLFDENDKNIIIVGDPVADWEGYEKTAYCKLGNIAWRGMTRTMDDIENVFFPPERKRFFNLF